MPAIAKGWKRLLIVLSVLWVLCASGLVTAERQSINVFDQFDQPPPQYIFWEWSPIDLLAPKEQQKRELTPRLLRILTVLCGPALGLWLAAWSFGWVRGGFKSTG